MLLLLLPPSFLLVVGVKFLLSPVVSALEAVAAGTVRLLPAFVRVCGLILLAVLAFVPMDIADSELRLIPAPYPRVTDLILESNP